MPTEPKLQLKLVQQAYKFGLDPTPAQARAFFSHAGGARYAYNWGLAKTAEALDAYMAEKDSGVAKPTTKIPRHFDLCTAWTAYKDDTASGVPWVGQNFVGTYQAALRDAATAWKNFFDSRSGKRAGRRVGRPRFKAKHRARKSFQVHGVSLRVADSRHVSLPKIGMVRTDEKTRKLLRRLRRANVVCTNCDGDRKVPNSKGEIVVCRPCKGAGMVPHTRLVRGTISQDSRGRWHIALTVETHREVRTVPTPRQREGGTIGVDMGVRDLVTLSDGTSIPNPRHLDMALRRLRRAQQDLSRCADGSNRRERVRKRVARLHGRVADLRRDALSKIASGLVHSYERIGVEGWDIQQTLQHGSKGLPRRVARDRNRLLASAGLGELRWMMESRASWYGGTVLVADRYQETGRTCSACGTVRTKPVPPADEQFMCLACGYVADRRLNTARALAAWAAAQTDAPSGGESRNARGGDVRPAASRRSGRSSPKREASTRPAQRGRGETGTPGP